jgi:ABC-2 type transport system permease protein
MTGINQSSELQTRAYNPFKALGYQLYCEIIRLLRNPGFLIPTLFFPIMFFSLFGLSNAGQDIGRGVKLGAYLLASYGTYGTLSAALLGFGVGIAAERGLGWNRLTRATPMHPITYFIAKILTAMLSGLVTLGLLFIFGALVANIVLPLETWLLLTARLLVGMMPFVALGLFIGYLGNPTSAAPITQLIFLPMSFASGIFIPISQLPQFIQNIAPYLPAYHSGQLAWHTLGAGDGSSLATHLVWILGFTILFLLLAIWAYKRDEAKQYG